MPFYKFESSNSVRGIGIGIFQSPGLAFGIRGRDACASPVRRNTPAMEYRVNVIIVSFGIFQTFKNSKAATLTRNKAAPPAVVNRHVLFGQGIGFCKTDKLKRIQTDVNASCQRQIQITICQAGGAGGHGKKG